MNENAPQPVATGDSDILVIGYGNELRGDDAIGPRVARAVRRRYPDLKTVAAHQLTPEMAARLAGVRLAIFVDAAITTGTRQQESRVRVEGR